MNILWIGGNHPRHLYYINKIQEKFPIAGSVIEFRENMLPTPPEGITSIDKENFIRHFKNRDLAEKKYFMEQAMPDCPILKTSRADLNSKTTVNFIKEINPDMVLIFGCYLIKEPLYSALPANTINLHAGLSPRYRGSATLFWPFYFLEPNYAGATFHYIIAEPDAGDIIHQVTPDLEKNDGIHDVACKVIIKSAEEMLKLLDMARHKKLKSFKQKATGKNFLTTDFKPEHLRIIYNIYNDDMVKCYLEGKLKSTTPKLKNQFTS